MPTKTTHVIPVDDGWTVKQEGRAERRPFKVYATQKEAIAAARALVKRRSSSQIVVHGRDGSMRSTDVRGLRAIQTSPVKSSLGTKAIKKAVSTVIRERLALDSRN